MIDYKGKEIENITEEQLNKWFNQCDRCGAIHRSAGLIWVSSEDFVPREGEIVPDEVYKYDALCDSCYLDVIEIKG
jgi:hypothetical protein